MASIRKRGSSYLIVVSMGYDYNGKRIKSQQKTVHPPEELTPKQAEKWLNEQAVLFERDCRHTPQPVQQLTLAKYIDLWLSDIAPGKLAKSTIRRDRQDIERILPALGHYKLTELRPEHFRNFYAELRKVIRPDTKKPLSEYTIEGVHATLCSILSDAVEGGFLSHNPAWRTYRYAGRKCEKKIADEETAQRIIAALEGESIKYETYFKLIIATGMRRGECCGLKWCDIDWEQRKLTICKTMEFRYEQQYWRAGPPKTKKSYRTIPLTNRAYQILQELYLGRQYRKESPELQKRLTYLDRKTGREKSFCMRDLVFVNWRTGMPAKNSSYDTHLYKLCDEAGIDHFCMHALRHTYATRAIESGMPPEILKQLLGHESIKTTMDKYVHVTDDRLLQAVAQFEKAVV